MRWINEPIPQNDNEPEITPKDICFIHTCKKRSGDEGACWLRACNGRGPGQCWTDIDTQQKGDFKWNG